MANPPSFPGPLHRSDLKVTVRVVDTPDTGIGAELSKRPKRAAHQGLKFAPG
jgi:hypothetical protein